MLIREATFRDIPQLQIVRHSVKENILSDPLLVTEQHYLNYLTKRGKGWLCETKEGIVAFAVVDLKEHNVWALFVRPEYEKKGIGKKLHEIMLDWYFTQTQRRLWLGTSPQTRAEKFYRKAGWIEKGKHGSVEIKFEMTYGQWKQLTTDKKMQITMETERLQLISCDVDILEKALMGKEALANYLNVSVPEKWTEFGEEPFRYALQKIRSSEASKCWWSYFPIYKQEHSLVGTCGYKGPPDENGMVEIGYEIFAEYRNRGLATELAQALIENAFERKEVKLVQAHTLAEVNASVKVLQKCGFLQTAIIEDEEDGLIWRWELKRMD